LHSLTHILPYTTTHGPQFKQIAAPLLVALLLHALALFTFYFAPADTTLTPRTFIEVSLDSSPQNSPPIQKIKTAPPAPQPVEVPVPKTVVEPTPIAQPTTQVSETPAVSPTTPVAVASNNAPATEEIQPLFRLTRMPSFQKKIEASYPISERRAGIQANVLAEVTIDSQGNVLEVRILKSGGTAFDEAVKQALQKSLFNPGIIDGKAVGTRFQVPFRFNLN
jgi:TonB family protein